MFNKWFGGIAAWLCCLFIMKATKQQQIETWLLNGQPLTAEIAFEKFGCRNLSLMILQLRKKGMKIDTETVLKNGSRYGRYVLAK